ncbi:MAG: hypothetical protein R3348_10160, partial [Xanthomonadales bacterium]|nr:hypothetical protein [Xanthomonadales bacterium]
SGALEEAQARYQEAALIEHPPVAATLKQSLVAIRRGDEPGARALIEEAEAHASEPQDRAQVRAAAEFIEYRLGRVRAAIDQLERRRAYLEEVVPPFQIAIGIYTPMVQYQLDIGNIAAARAALDSALSVVQPPLDQFLAFSEASILLAEGELDAAEAALGRALAIIEQFKLEELKFQAEYLMGHIEFERGRYAESAAQFQSALTRIERSVLSGSDVNLLLPGMYGLLARSQVFAGELEAAEQALEKGFEQDPAEPALWLSRARFQHASGMSALAAASVNYALAIWKDADPEFRWARTARKLASDIQSDP